ncbi:hypothetical protein LJY25_14885 [Hymenobacter sp. BT175]|uniref:hypothetical protein n=1 Tax=Hymenobacter translucens TaxID=2886507 RepID=UPI001D0F1467|nr:hypothetical protein [Hymenobacter translucens]MCC2547739.1 hypothetical protein [Hymenobacter translucens]
MPVLYANYFGILKDVAQQHGYALALHGSFVRDMDLIAVPWTETASLQAELIKGCFEAIGWTHGEDSAERVYNARTEKPHGRTAYAIPTGGGGYVDLSVMRLAA